MRILDLLKKRLTPAPKTLVLDPAQKDAWAEELASFTGLDKEFALFTERTSDLVHQAETALEAFADDGVLSAIPDRARTMNALHGNEYAGQVRKLLATASFTGLFDFERQQDAYFEANAAFKDQTAKNVSALNEFMHDEVKATQALLQQIEDTVINFMKTLEEHKYPVIRKIRDLTKKVSDMKARGEKYEALLASLKQDLQRVTEKKRKLDDDMHAQAALIRNDAARLALEKLGKTEQELHRIVQQYVAVCDDVKAICKRYPALRLDAKTKRVVDELPKDGTGFLAENAESITAAFETIVSQLEDEQVNNVRRTIEQLTKLAKSAQQDGRTVVTTLPDLRSLKRDVLRDIAAVNIYDKQQFWLRARTEEETVNAKITYITQELDPNRREALEREIRAYVRELGVMIADAPADDNASVTRNEPQGPSADGGISEEAESRADIEPEHEK